MSDASAPQRLRRLPPHRIRARCYGRCSHDLLVPKSYLTHSAMLTVYTMHTQVRVAFIGAGGINFGTPEGPWNHSSRLEQLPGVTFTAIVDPNGSLAQKRVDDMSKGSIVVPCASFCLHATAGSGVSRSTFAMLTQQGSTKRSGQTQKSSRIIMPCWRTQMPSLMQHSLVCPHNIMVPWKIRMPTLRFATQDCKHSPAVNLKTWWSCFECAVQTRGKNSSSENADDLPG